MTLSAGTRLGRYEIRSQLGVGGMGEVYLAQDTKLDRKVALKILPAEVASKQERMARFVREAKAAAALNHPNIAHIYEIGEEDGVQLIAMEFVDGQTLRQKIHREHADLRKLLRYLQQVAEGLAKAHAAGIVHRDLKPDNIMISRDGYAKILDFGLAKLIEPTLSMGQPNATDEGLSEVATAVMPQHSLPGTIMGTVGYMSPEQAQGKINEIDHRSDIFSFGCILFEAATGRKAFEGKDTLDSLHNIVHAPTPQIKELNPLAPDELQKIVRRCLAKDPEKRYQSIKDVAIELDELRQELKEASELHDSVHHTAAGATMSGQMGAISTDERTASSTQIESRQPTSSSKIILNELRRNKRGVLLGLAVLVIAIGAAWFIWQKFVASKKQPLVAVQMKISRLTSTGKVYRAAISPDGKYVVHGSDEGDKTSLWVRQVATSSNVQIIPPAAGYYRGLTFSPDGNYVYYVWGQENPQVSAVYQIPVLGGTAIKLIEDAGSPITFSGDSHITFSGDGKQFAFVRLDRLQGESSIIIANADGSGERKFATRKSPEAFRSPAWSPDGKAIACTIGNSSSNDFSLFALQVADGSVEDITKERWRMISDVVWNPDGGALIMTAAQKGVASDKGQLWRVNYPDGELRRITNDLNDYFSVSLTDDGTTLVTVQGEVHANIWVGSSADISRAKQITFSAGTWNGAYGLAWTSDGRLVYPSNVGGGNEDIWIMKSDGTEKKQLTSVGVYNEDPAVTSDDRYILFQSNRSGATHIWRMGLDGGNPLQLTKGAGAYDPQGSPDGKWVFYTSSFGLGVSIPKVWKVSIDGGEPIQITDKYSLEPKVSPDGKLIACWWRGDDIKSRSKIAIIPSEGGAPINIFERPPNVYLYNTICWTADARAILFSAGAGSTSNIWRQPVDGGQPLQLTNIEPELIFSFDLSKDGRQIGYARGTETTDAVLISDFR